MGNAEEIITPDRAIISDFRADGSKSRKGEQENQIVWGGNDKGYSHLNGNKKTVMATSDGQNGRKPRMGSSS